MKKIPDFSYEQFEIFNFCIHELIKKAKYEGIEVEPVYVSFEKSDTFLEGSSVKLVIKYLEPFFEINYFVTLNQFFVTFIKAELDLRGFTYVINKEYLEIIPTLLRDILISVTYEKKRFIITPKQSKGWKRPFFLISQK